MPARSGAPVDVRLENWGYFGSAYYGRLVTPGFSGVSGAVLRVDCEGTGTGYDGTTLHFVAKQGESGDVQLLPRVSLYDVGERLNAGAITVSALALTHFSSPKPGELAVRAMRSHDDELEATVVARSPGLQDHPHVLFVAATHKNFRHIQEGGRQLYPPTLLRDGVADIRIPGELAWVDPGEPSLGNDWWKGVEIEAVGVAQAEQVTAKAVYRDPWLDIRPITYLIEVEHGVRLVLTQEWPVIDGLRLLVLDAEVRDSGRVVQRECILAPALNGEASVRVPGSREEGQRPESERMAVVLRGELPMLPIDSRSVSFEI